MHPGRRHGPSPLFHVGAPDLPRLYGHLSKTSRGPGISLPKKTTLGRGSMKRSMVFALAVVAALTVAGYAVATGTDGKSIKAVTATFSATSASRVDTRTCTTSDGKTLVITDATYTGTASGDPDLTGAATVRARSAINTTDGVGTVSGSLRIDVSGSDTRADFTSVYQGGHIAGLAAGYAHDPRARL